MGQQSLHRDRAQPQPVFPLSDSLPILEHEPPSINTNLETLRRQHQLILNSVGDGVYGVDLHGNVTFVNPAAAAMIGWTVEELIGRSMHAILHHSHADGTSYPLQACPIYAAFQDGIVHRVNDEVFWRKDGSCFPVEYISTPMHDEQGKLIGAVIAFRDITQRKWAETVLQQANEELELKVQERTAELQQLNAQLQELNELKSRLVSMVCHEFRNPLNNILLSVSYLDRYDEQLQPQQKTQHFSDIHTNVDRMTQMIDDILVIGKVEAKKIELQPVSLNLVEFCRQLVEEMQAIAPANPIHFICQRKTLSALIDERLLRSILTNILANSVRYSPANCPIQFKLTCRDEQFTFQVKDQGIGIPADDIPYLFEPFHRGRNVSNIPGTGLGLSIVKKFVDLQQGEIAVQSKVGHGTTFTVRLPRQSNHTA
ncbi:MAG: PAS domain S-box protein [Oscillatoriales cyanobacterium C42_A2020_001]|nr:PAS domain S-box protein [Leptolyngbyaceae cyanobacterium C42_A2020_001]